MVRTGLDGLLRETGKYSRRNMALIANHTSVTSGLTHSWNEFRHAGLNLVRIFSPEHGLFGVEQDQVPVTLRQLEGFDIVSLYGTSMESLSPPGEFLDDIDLVLFDIQDIGTRYYTYAATLILFMKALRGRDIEIMVLDRPNPLGGDILEGPGLDPGFESFVGLISVPVRHGLTVGEMALLARDVLNLDVNLTIKRMEGWNRSAGFAATGLPWVPPSPNMPSLSTALVYPGMCLFEGTNLSEGRGTTCPFELLGAPFMDPGKIISHPALSHIPGAALRPHYFRPSFHKFSGQVCGGFFLHVTDSNVFQSFRAGVALIRAIQDMCPEFRFTRDVYEFNKVHPAFDLLTGGSIIREMIESGASMDDITLTWTRGHEAMSEFTSKYHIY